MYWLLSALILSVPLSARSIGVNQWSLETYYTLKADVTCCPQHGDEASCNDEGGSNCVWFPDPNAPIPADSGSQCVGKSYAKCKRDNGITACCAPGCNGGGPPKPTTPGGGGGGDPTGPVCGPSSAGLTPQPTTKAPTTKSPTTKSPTTKSPTTKAPTTKSPTTKSPTTKSPTTKAPTTKSPTTKSPTTKSPTTKSPTTKSPTTKSPTTKSPTTKAPTTKSPTTKSPTTKSPTTKSPTTKSPTTKSPTTKSPTTKSPTTKAPTTTSPTTKSPTTKSPTTKSPTTKSPTTTAPTTKSPTTKSPTTKSPTTKSPTTSAPTTKSPTTKSPTTKAPTTTAPTTQAPTTKSPTSTTASSGSNMPTKNPVELGPDCALGVNYAFEGYPCQINGDPHFIVFSGNNHDYQGQPDKSIGGLLRNQYYYITQCTDAAVEQMPFRLLGSHYKMYPTVTGLDVLTFELFDTNFATPDFYLFVHPEFVSYVSGTGNSDYDMNNAGDLTDISAGSTTNIGSKFKVNYQRQSANTIIFTLTIDNTNDIIINLNGQNGDSTRYRMNYAVVQLPSVYKCRACGMCGDFNHPWTNQDIEFLSGCDGGDIGYRAGLSADTTPEAYDIYGWSFEKYYWQQQCSTDGYNTSSGDFQYIEPCDANIKDDVKAECTKAVFRKANCCNNFPDICQDLQADCVFDACVLSTDSNGVGDTSLIPDSVYHAFDIAFNQFCDLAENSQLFGTPAAGGDLSECKKGWEQCGGNGYTGVTCCKLGYECTGSEWYKQCAALPPGSGPCQDNWAQCYGKYYNGKECCNDGYACIRDTEFYSQCLEIPDNLKQKGLADYMVIGWMYKRYNNIIENNIAIGLLLILLLGAAGRYYYKSLSSKDDKYIPILREEPTRWSNKIYQSYNKV